MHPDVKAQHFAPSHDEFAYTVFLFCARTLIIRESENTMLIWDDDLRFTTQLSLSPSHLHPLLAERLVIPVAIESTNCDASRVIEYPTEHTLFRD